MTTSLPTPKRTITARLAVAVVVGASLTLAACGGASGHAGASSATTGIPSGKLSTSSGSSTTSTTSPPSVSAGSSATSSTAGALALQKAFVDVVKKVRPEVVEISTTKDLGSGIIYNTRGDIVTNHHVVGSATTFKVRLVDGQTLTGHLVGAYAPDDLAVIKVSGAKHLTPATFGDSSKVQVGDIVMAVGNPLGLASSVTEGIVSYNGRTVAESSSVVLPSTIQTSAPINPGNSGGALVGLNGKVIGIPTLAAVDPQLGGGAAPGIGFAIPSNTIKLIANQIIAKGKVTHSGRAYIGVVVGDAINAVGQPVGALVGRVLPGTGAAKAGIRPGEAIVALNGQPVTNPAQLEDLLAGLKPGDKARVTLLSPSGAKRTVTVTLGQLPG